MPLTPRPGVFRGQVMNKWTWYVVDPAAVDPEVGRERWEADYASTNAPRWRRVVGTVVPWATFVVTTFAVVALATWVYSIAGDIPAREILVAWIGVLGFIGAIVLGFVVANAIYPTVVFPEDPHPEVVAVPGAVEKWAAENIPVDELWALVWRYDRVEQIAGDDDEYPYPRPWFAPQLDAVVAELAVAEYAALEAVADRLGFPIPAELRPRSAR
jgi:hypothetical protein